MKKRKLTWTRSGKVFLVLLVLSLLLSYWMRQSLLFLLSSFFVAFLLVDLFFSLVLFRNLRVNVANFDDGFKNSLADLEISLGSIANWFVTWTSDAWIDCYFSDGSNRWVLRAGHGLKIQWNRPKRGSVLFNQCVVCSGFPFGFFLVHVAHSLKKQAFVFPLPLISERAPMFFSGQGMDAFNFDEYNMLEPYREGDDVRHIHWKKSTFSTSPVVRKNRGEQKIENASLFVPDPTPDFEKALGILVERVLEKKWNQWSLFRGEGEIQVFATQLDFLRALATIQPLSFKPDPGFHILPLFASDLACLPVSNRIS